MQYTKPLAKLIEYFQKLPSIGPKSAQRMALHLLKMPLSEVEKFADSMIEAKNPSLIGQDWGIWTLGKLLECYGEKIAPFIFDMESLNI